jgi:hypothetical protein
MYISPSNIIETDHTTGNQFVVKSTQVPYSGFYHKDKFGKYWTGQTHTEDSKQLTKLFKDPVFTLYSNPPSAYLNLNPIIIPNNNLQSDFISPSDDDYNNGYFLRYFFKFNNSIDPKFVEVNKDTFKKTLQITNINLLYSGASMIWLLMGPINDIYDENNIRIQPGVKDTNLRSIQETEKLLENISLYVTDPLQFTRL